MTSAAPAPQPAVRSVALALLIAGELLLLPAPITWSAGTPRLISAAAALAAGICLLVWRGLGPFVGYTLELVGMATLPPRGQRLVLLVAAPVAALGVALLALVLLSAALPAPPSAPSAARAGGLLAAGTPLALGHVLGIAVMEELAFRGPVVLVARVWGDSRRVVVSAVVASAVLFASAHAAYGWLNVSHACVQGLMWGSLAVVSRSLWPSIGAHALFDAVALLA